MSEYLDKQLRFCLMIADLIQVIFASGYACKFGFAFRCKECPVGLQASLHKQSLAVDLLMFKVNPDGSKDYLANTNDYQWIGEYWEAQGGTWGGRFGDGNHFSLEHGGIK